MAKLTPADALRKANGFEQAGKFSEAEVLYRKLATHEPKNAAAYRGLGVCLRRLGRIDDAAMALVRATELRPDYAEAFNSLGNCLQDKKQLGAAMICWEKAIKVKSDYPEPHFNMGAALRRVGNLRAAEILLRKAVELRPNYVDALNTLGNVLRDNGQLDNAVACYEQVVRLLPTHALGYNNLGNALKDAGRLSTAEEYLRRAIALDESVAEFHLNLGSVLQDSGRIDEAQDAWKQALALRPDFAEAGSNLLLSLHYYDGNDGPFVYREHVGWAKRFASSLTKTAPPHAAPVDRASIPRKLRVGYVSPDFRRHSVAYFIESVLQSHDKEKFDAICYSDVARPDEVTARLRNHATEWRSIVGFDDARVADLVRQDSIDILVDLAGHTAHNRQLVFARRPAPVQVTYLGYCNTTGQTAIDYAITDRFVDPVGPPASSPTTASDASANDTTACPSETPADFGQSLHVEKLVRLPRCFVCYRPSHEAPDVAPLPARANGFVTFGSFNNLTKITPDVSNLWATILITVPGARLLVKSAGLGEAMLRQQTVSVFTSRGIDANRLELLDREPSYTRHLGAYARVDIALDTFPYHGTTTTCEAMWMGVPTVTLAGTTRVSRVGVSLNSNAGLDAFIAETPEEYVEIAKKRAAELDQLSTLRAGLRDHMLSTGLVDSVRFTRELEAEFFSMSQARVANASEPIVEARIEAVQP